MRHLNEWLRRLRSPLGLVESLRRAFLGGLMWLHRRRSRVNGPAPATVPAEGRLEEHEIESDGQTLRVLAFDELEIDARRDPPDSAAEWIAAAQESSPRPTFPMATYLKATEKLRHTTTAFTQYLEADAGLARDLAAELLGEPSVEGRPPVDVLVQKGITVREDDRHGGPMS